MVTIEQIKTELENRGENFSEEFTDNNYSDNGNIISGKVPTLTTRYCEIGFYGQTIYFVFIARSDSYSPDFLKKASKIKNLKIYGLKNFLNDYDLTDNIEAKIKSEPYFQIQFNFENTSAFSCLDLLRDYDLIIKLLEVHRVEVVDQLKSNFA